MAVVTDRRHIDDASLYALLFQKRRRLQRTAHHRPTSNQGDVVAIALALPSAYALARIDFPGKRLVDTFIDLPMVLTPIALGTLTVNRRLPAETDQESRRTDVAEASGAGASNDS